MKKQCPITKKLIADAIPLVEKGVPWDVAAPVGVSMSQMKRWVQLGKEMDDIVSTKGAYPKGSGKLEWMAHELFLALSEAQKKFIKTQMGRVVKATGKSWMASTWLLERRAKEHFGKQSEVQLSSKPEEKGAEGASVPKVVLLQLPDNGRIIK